MAIDILILVEVAAGKVKKYSLELAGVAHLIPMERPELFAELVISHLEENGV